MGSSLSSGVSLYGGKIVLLVLEENFVSQRGFLFVFNLIGSKRDNLFCSVQQHAGEAEQMANGNLCNSTFRLFSSFCQLICYYFDHFGQVDLRECWDTRWISPHTQLFSVLIRV